MIYTVTTNPALDYLMYTESAKLGQVNRSTSERIFVGGKGINVSIILSRLGVLNTALGFAGGFTGDEICRRIALAGVLCDFVRTDGQSRINVKLRSDEETAINGKGPLVSYADEEKLLEKLRLAGEGDIVVISGASANSESGKLTENILKAASKAKIVADMEGDELLMSLPYEPLLIKPNAEELAQIFGKDELRDEEIVSCAFELREKGARNVLVSLGSRGAILAAEDGGIYRKEALRGEVKSTVGAGDSMVAGFISALPLGYRRALEVAVAAGSATAFSDDLASVEELSLYIGKN